MKDILITRDSNGRCRVIEISCDFDSETNSYIISRSSGLFSGKKTVQPSITVSKGKVKRTLDQQATLEYNSIVKKLLDKGYKNIKDLEIDILTQEAIDEKLPATKTNQHGVLKPMLCKVLDKTNTKLTNKTWWASNKLDGVRNLLYWDGNEVKTSSRGGGDYNIAATYIRTDPYVIKLFKANPDLILDGEIYRHGWPLNKISGLCRKETLEDEHNELKFYCYDVVDESSKFKDRLNILEMIRESCPIDSKLVIVSHIKVSGLDEITKAHDASVAAGFEGLVIRDPDKEYKCSSRDNRMCKLKEFQDAEFKVTGISEGLREEDMCFTLETKEGYPFKAKPIGTREDKQWYREHINELIGKMATVKYFGMTNTDTSVPNLPVLKCIRYD